MKSVVNGKLYDTDNAQYICQYSFGYQNDFRYVLEELYKSPNNTFFLFYEGGSCSKYGIKTGQNEVCIGENCNLSVLTDFKIYK